MTRSQALLDDAVEALQSATPATIYGWVQQLDSEYTRHRYPELLIHSLPKYPLDRNQSRAIIAAVAAMQLAIKLQLHKHSRRVLAAAVMCRSLNDSLSEWQAMGLKHPLWRAAFSPGNKERGHDSLYFCKWCLAIADAQHEGQTSQLEQLLTGVNRHRYWLFAKHLDQPPTLPTGSLLEHRQNGQLLYLLVAESSHWLTFDAQRQKLARIAAAEIPQWQLSASTPDPKVLKQLDYIRALNQNLPETSFQAPKKLLSAIKRYTSGSGALAPVIHHISQRPLLAESIRLAAARENMQANDPWRMDLKHVYLWLGGTKASVVLATASLQQQFMQQRVSLQQSLMQRLNLLTELLIEVCRRCRISLPAPASLLTLLTAADLFREPRLLRAASWPEPKLIDSFKKQAWLGVSAETQTSVAEQRLERQLIARWQLDKQLQSLSNDDTDDPLVTAMSICNLLVLKVFHPNARYSDDVRRQLSAKLQTLKLDEKALNSAISAAIAKSAPCCPLTELSAAQ